MGNGPPKHISTLSKRPKGLVTSDGTAIDVWDLTVDEQVDLSAWAKHFRQHYCADSEIDALREGTGLSRSEYLKQIIFPDEKMPPGPSVRAGDFGELVVSDFVEYLLGYWVPRGKYAEKAARNESIRGIDILGFRGTSLPNAEPGDTMLAFEVKAQCSGDEYGGRLQTAIDDSSKDYLRRAETLNATKRRLLKARDKARAAIVQRFQSPSDRPYVYLSGAAAVLSDRAYDEELLSTATTVTGHNNPGNIRLVVIKGRDLMRLVHTLYEKAADEA